MPATKLRTRIIAQNFISSSGLNVDDFFPWQEYFIAGSSRAMAGSMSVYDISGSTQGLLFQSASSTCAIWVQHPVPLNLATSKPAAASGTVYVDWTNASSNSASLTITACFMWIPPGSAVGDVGTCTLGSGCVTVVGTTASELQTASLFEFNVPASAIGWWGLRAIVNTKDNATSTSPVIIGYRVRYRADRIGN